MNTKKFFCIVSLLIIILITGCEAAQTTEIITSEDPEIKDAEAYSVIDEDEIDDQEEPSLPEEVGEPPIDSQDPLTNKNTLELIEIQYLSKGNINEIAWSPNGSPIALATATGIYLVDPETYEEVHFSKAASESVAFSKDGTTLACAEKDIVILRDLETGDQTAVFEGHTEMVYQIAFSPVDEILASASSDVTIKLWSLGDGKLINTFDSPGTYVYDVAFSFDGKTLISAAPWGLISLWDVESGDVIKMESKVRGNHFAVSPQKELIAAFGHNDPFILLDFSGQEVITLEKEVKVGRDLAFSPDGKILASASDDTPEDFGTDYTLKLWDTTSGELLHILEDAGGYYNISFSPDGTQVAAATSDKVKLWDIESGQEIGIITDQPDISGKEGFGKSFIYDFAWSPDGKTIALHTFSALSLIDIYTHEEIVLASGAELHFTGTGHYITFSPDGKMLAVSYGEEVKVYDIESQQALFTLDDFGEKDEYKILVFGVAFSPEGDYLATALGLGWGLPPGSIRIWDVASRSLLQEFGIGNQPAIHDLTFNKEGNLLATIDAGGQVRIWNFPEGTDVLTFTGTGTSGYGDGIAVAFSPDGRLLAAGGRSDWSGFDPELHLFDSSSGDLLFDLEGHRSTIFSLAFNKDGNLLASASDDGTVRMWDIQNGEQLAVLDIPGANSVDFSPDGTLLATAGWGDVLRLWSVPEETTGTNDTAPDTTSSYPEIETGTIPALVQGEDFRPGAWSPDGRYYFYSQQGPIDEPGPDQAYNTLYLLDTQTGEICPGLVETLTMNVSAWGAYPEGPHLDQRTFWMADQRLLYISPEGELLALTPCSETIEDWTERLPEPVTDFNYHRRNDQTQLLINGESGTWLFTPSTGQSVKVDLPASNGYGETWFSWSPYEARLFSSRFEEREDWFGVVVEDIDLTMGEASLILELPIKQEGLSKDSHQHVIIQWLAKDLLNLSHWLDYSGNFITRDLVVDISDQPEVIADVFPDLFGMETLNVNQLTSWGYNGNSDGQNYYFVVCEGFLPDGQFHLYSSETGSVETYSLKPPKLLLFPNGSYEIAEVIRENTTSEDTYQVILVGTDKAPFDLQIQGYIPGQTSWSKVATLPGTGELLIATDQGIALVDLDSGETVAYWVLENQAQYVDFILALSPDEKSVIVFAMENDEDDEWSGSTIITAIYYLPLDN